MAADTPLRTDRQVGQVVDPNDINTIADRVNVNAGRFGALTLDNLLDVAVPLPAPGDVLTWDATQGLWVSVQPAAQSGGGGAAVSSVAGRTGAVVLGKGDVGLGNVDNTSDASKPISTLQQAALNGKATLDVNGKIPTTQLPSLAITEYLGTANSNAAMLALAGQRGDFVTRTDSTIMADGAVAVGDWILTADAPNVLTSWHRLTSPSTTSGGITSVAGKTGPAVTLAPADVTGLQALLDAKAGLTNSRLTLAQQPTGYVYSGTYSAAYAQPSLAAYLTSIGAPGRTDFCLRIYGQFDTDPDISWLRDPQDETSIGPAA